MSAEYLKVARALSEEAAGVVMDLLKSPISKNQKADHSWVTEADLKADRIIRDGLEKAFPTHGVLTEESGMSGNQDSEWMWLVDPLDGTKAYTKGGPGFSVMVGLLNEGKPYLGVVVDPILGLTYEAVRGEGAWLGSKRLHVSGRKDFSQMPLVHSSGFPQEALKQIENQLHSPLCPPINSVGIKIGLVVRQEADIYISHHSVHYWDTCAPQVILEEAGGTLTRLDNQPLTYTMNGTYDHGTLILVTNGTRHKEVAKIVSQVACAFPLTF